MSKREFKLTKEENSKHEALLRKLAECADAIDEAVETFNAAMVTARAPVQAALDAYNAVLNEACDFARTIAEPAMETINKRSQRWQESETGGAVTDWQEAWQMVADELDDPMEVAWPEPLDRYDEIHWTQLHDAGPAPIKKLAHRTEILTEGEDRFVVYDGKRVARRGRAGTPWISLEPGWTVMDFLDDETAILHDGFMVA
jgi:hypothetical protein